MISLEWALLALAVGSFTITENYRPFVTLGLVLLGAAFIARWVRTKHLVPRTGMEAPIGFFLVSSGMAAWIAFDPGPARLQLARILAAAVLYWAVVEATPQVRRLAALAFLLAAGLLAVYWPLQHDFATDPGKFALITGFGRWLNGHAAFKVTTLTGDSIHSNVAGGTLALAIPFGFAFTWEAWRARRGPAGARILVAIGPTLVTLLIFAGLALTSSRGAWLGFAGAIVLFGLAWFQQRLFSSPRSRVIYWTTILAASGIVVAGLFATHTLDWLVGRIPDPNGTLVGRPQLWIESLPLLRDYAFTGSGLMTFPLVFSIYGILIHVPYLSHLHNTFLEVWLEQGALGAAAVFWAIIVAGVWVWRGGEHRFLQAEASDSSLAWAGLAALFIAAFHGIFDVVFYVERTLPLIGFVAGYAALLDYRNTQAPERTVKRTFSFQRWAIPSLLVVVILVLAVFFYRPIIAQAYANQGAVLQTRIELAQYDPNLFATRGIDVIRQQSDLQSAEFAFRQALRWDPTNPTALQRLAEISLSKGQYEAALKMMQTAWEAGERYAVTRLLLGDALVATGQPVQAADLVRGLTWAKSRLMGQAWYRYWIHADFQRSAEAWSAVSALDPTDQTASEWQKQARMRVK